MSLREALSELRRLEWRELDLADAAHWPLLAQVISCSLLSMCLVLGAVLLLVRPDQQALAKGEQREAELMARYRHKVEQLASLPEHRERLAAYRSRLDALSRAFPATPDTGRLVDAIGVVARQTGVRLTSVRLGEPVEALLVAHPLSLQASGSFHQLAAFMAGVSDLPRWLTLHDMRLRSHERSLQLTVQVRAYQQASGGAVTLPAGESEP